VRRLEIVHCFNPACTDLSYPGISFCDSCLTEMNYKRLSVFDMFDNVCREEVVWDRGSPNFGKKIEQTK